MAAAKTATTGSLVLAGTMHENHLKCTKNIQAARGWSVIAGHEQGSRVGRAVASNLLDSRSHHLTSGTFA